MLHMYVAYLTYVEVVTTETTYVDRQCASIGNEVVRTETINVDRQCASIGNEVVRTETISHEQCAKIGTEVVTTETTTKGADLNARVTKEDEQVWEFICYDEEKREERKNVKSMQKKMK
ncbi:hypothetical protein L1987_60014 [Smallanthus sonchifolius]|uniref:Uncharacterized protein n=1 Tax=Smallanthus sonchifolius TaxID=185202 RepID=A0ACB9D6X1_9ASTR|nr:hypothetical protein L1987_60014 [Smallanthus sonchifolius]